MRRSRWDDSVCGASRVNLGGRDRFLSVELQFEDTRECWVSGNRHCRPSGGSIWGSFPSERSGASILTRSVIGLVPSRVEPCWSDWGKLEITECPSQLLGPNSIGPAGTAEQPRLSGCSDVFYLRLRAGGWFKGLYIVSQSLL